MSSKCLPVRSKLPKRWDCRLSCLTCGVKAKIKGFTSYFLIGFIRMIKALLKQSF